MSRAIWDAQKVDWPPHFHPDKADLFARNEIEISAPAERIWGHLIAAARWPEWFPNAKNVRMLDQPSLNAGARFAWEAGGLEVDCVIIDWAMPHRLTWLGSLPGADAPIFCHVWLIVPQGQATHVISEETGRGELPKTLSEEDPDALTRGNEMWLTALKSLSETA